MKPVLYVSPPPRCRNQFSIGVSGHCQPANSTQAPQIAAGTCAQAIARRHATRTPPRITKSTKIKCRRTVASARIRKTTGNVSQVCLRSRSTSDQMYGDKLRARSLQLRPPRPLSSCFLFAAALVLRFFPDAKPLLLEPSRSLRSSLFRVSICSVNRRSAPQCWDASSVMFMSVTQAPQ